eukprot:m.365621 g.365621  ORF g.365621 m.365621 type:complete len:56 (-) comp32255_c0_seq1:127-294(-)
MEYMYIVLVCGCPFVCLLNVRIKALEHVTIVLWFVGECSAVLAMIGLTDYINELA